MKVLYSNTDMANTASMELFKQGRRLGSKSVKFPFYRMGPNHCTFILLPHEVKTVLFTLLTEVRGAGA